MDLLRAGDDGWQGGMGSVSKLGWDLLWGGQYLIILEYLYTWLF